MDYVDLYIYHMWDWNTPVEEYLEAMAEGVKALEEYYEPHVLSGVMAQNTPAARTTEQVWIKNGKYSK